MSRWIKALAIALVAAVCLSLCGFAGECGQIREQVLRLHVLANSDSDADQRLKLQVRDTVVATAAGLFDQVTDKSGAIEQVQAMLPQILAAAQQRVYDEGYDYTVNAELCHMYFTTRSYDTVTLPAGMYDALRITIGEGGGRNWWCVVFPPMCVSAATEGAELSEVLDEQQTDIVTQPQRYEVRFRVVEIFEELAHRVRLWFSGDDTTAIE